MKAITEGLNTDQEYYFALKSASRSLQMSKLFNVVKAKTEASKDTAPPGGIFDLSASDSTENTVILNWTVSGNNGFIGVADYYDIRYSTSPITREN